MRKTQLQVANRSLLHTSEIIRASIAQASQQAESQGKKLLVIVLENHIHPMSLLHQVIALNIAFEKHAISTIICEFNTALLRHLRNNPSAPLNASALVSYADKMGFDLLPADSDEANASDEVRMNCIKAKLHMHNDDAVFILGLNHLEDFLEDTSLSEKYTVVAFNGTGFNEVENMFWSSLTGTQYAHMRYASNPDNAIQLNSCVDISLCNPHDIIQMAGVYSFLPKNNSNGSASYFGQRLFSSPAATSRQEESCGFKPGFLIGKRF